MGRTRHCWNTATPEQIAARGRAMRPTLPAPDGEQTWYRVTNSLDEGGSPFASISIYGDIGAWGITAASFMEELKAVDAPEIRLSLNSPGGDAFDGLAINNALRSHRAKVIVRVDSIAASIASVIAMAGDRVIMSPHSQLMIHDAATVAQGNPEELREMADFLDRQSDNIAAVYAERAGGTVKQWRTRMRQETWYYADEAVAAGLADEVAKPERQTEGDQAVAAEWDLKVYNYAHTSREEAPAPLVETAPETSVAAALEPPVFDPASFRAAATAALDPMPGYQPEHLRSLMAGIASDAPAVPAPVRQEAPYVPRPIDQTPEPDPQEVAVGWWRSVFAGVANDAPAQPPSAAPAPVAEAPQTVYVPTPPPPAGQVVAEYMRAVLTDVANNAPAPPGAPQPERIAPEPVQTIDPSVVRRALWEAEL